MSLLSGLEHCVRQDEPLAPYTWFRLGGPAEYFAEPTSVEDLSELVRRCRDQGLPVRLLGGGSNVLITEAGVPGLVVRLAAPCFGDIQVSGSIVTAGGGAKLGHVITTAVREGLAGLEKLVGLPGTVGGALHGNAGSRDTDVGQWTAQATVMTRAGEIHVRQRDDLVFAYRQSSLDELVILGVQFQLERDDPQEVARRMQKQWIVKKAAQPLGHQNTGCIFRNPGGMNANSLIDQAGLKGTSIGGAEVSDRHANFIVADSSATSQDVLRLIELVQTQVQERLGVTLEREIQVW